MRFYEGNSFPMEVGDEDAEGHVVAKGSVDINDEEDAGEKQDDDTVCLVPASDTFAQNVDDVGGVPFLAGSPSVTQGIQFIDASSCSVSTADSSSLLKTTHIVIHKQTLKGGLVSPLTPLTPSTPAIPNSLQNAMRYQWDQSAFNPVIPVRCKSSNGELHKAKFGSGMIWLFNFSDVLIDRIQFSYVFDGITSIACGLFNRWSLPK